MRPGILDAAASARGEHQCGGIEGACVALCHKRRISCAEDL